MSSELKVEDLEKSLVQRANDLAEEYLQRAKRSHDHFIEDENERLQLREEKELLASKISAESLYRSRVQSSELNAQKRLDQLRWQLIKNVITEVKEKITNIAKNKDKYQQLLIAFINHGTAVIDSNHIIVELNQDDYLTMQSQWNEILEQIDSDKKIELSTQFHHHSGGVIVYDQNRSIRIDNSFEGRIERLSDSIYQLVAKQFFSELSHEGDKIHGR
ncbi:MAG: V-type ATP synthase subunit E family protein [Pseudomonadota bacterium]